MNKSDILLSHEERFGTPWVWRRTSLLMKDGNWIHETPSNPKRFFEQQYLLLRWEEKHPYFHLLSDGTYQSCIATIHVEEREWIHEQTADRKISKDICVDFDNELGSGVGTWKGGVVGCLYKMFPGESPLQTLRRMERERNFNR